VVRLDMMHLIYWSSRKRMGLCSGRRAGQVARRLRTLCVLFGRRHRHRGYDRTREASGLPASRRPIARDTFVQTGNGCSIEDAVRRPVADQDVDVLGNLSVKPFPILCRTHSKCATVNMGVTGEPHTRNP